MNINEEIFAFRHELGLAIAQWGYVEGQLLRIAVGCVGQSDREALAISYHSIENFRSKLTMCHNLVMHRFGKSPHFEHWCEAKDRTESLASRRNKIAHGWQRLYVHAAAGRRWAIIPLHHENGNLIHVDGEKAPNGSICLRDLVSIRMEFHALTTELCNLYEIFRGRSAPFPKRVEDGTRLPTIHSIRNRMYAELGVSTKTSRKQG